MVVDVDVPVDVDVDACRLGFTGKFHMKTFSKALSASLKKAYGLSLSLASTFRDAGRIFLSSRAFDHAASISFFSLLSVAPFLILLVSAAGYLAVILGPASDVVEQFVAQLTEVLRRFAPVEGDSVRDVVYALVERRGQFGLLGAVVMLLGASMVFGALEHAMEDIFQVVTRRRFLTSRMIFSAILVASGFTVFLLHYAMTFADAVMEAVAGQTFDEWLRESAALDAALTYLPVPLGFLAALYVPGIARVRPWRGLAGALLFFVLWELAREAFAYYVTSVASYGVLYGSLATPILLILWTFYSANILLFSVAFVAALERRGKNGLAIPAIGG